jgi:hypothetical protein
LPAVPASKGRQLAAVPSGTVVRIVMRTRSEEAVIERGAVVWRGRRYDSASSAARAMRGSDATQVNGWKDLKVELASGELISLLDAYDARRWDELAGS